MVRISSGSTISDDKAYRCSSTAGRGAGHENRENLQQPCGDKDMTPSQADAVAELWLEFEKLRIHL